MNYFLKKYVPFVIAILAFTLVSASGSAEKIKVACVGNSITYGAGIENRESFSYPAQLQKMLGENYQVGNFGKSGATLLSKGHRPYIQSEEYQLSLTFKPDWVIIHLGVNDTDPRNWPNYKDEFITDYTNLIQSYIVAGTQKENIFICKMTPVFNGHPRFKSGTRDWFWQIQKAIEQVAKNNRVGLIDLHTPLYARPDLFEDAVHPNREGAEILAKTVADFLSGNYGGLKLAPFFTNHMVLQQNKKINVWGKANTGQKITVSFQTQQKVTAADESGNWQVQLNPVSAGGPFEPNVNAENEEQIKIQDILVGEVWLCSGQSNMEFPLKNEFSGTPELSEQENPNLRLFYYKGLKNTGPETWDSTSMEKINRLQYFEGKWEKCTPEKAANFSAIGYYFGKALADSLHVPVGIIEIAVGGAPVESFIDRKTLEFNPLLVDVLFNWKENDFIMPWCRERARQNLANSKNAAQRHPFEPAYIFEAGISNVIHFPFQGVIWYQGESNAHNTEHYNNAFPELIQSWREAFENPEMPFYFAQLSSLDRPSWPEFRDCQRQLALQTENSGMVVTSDFGDSLNVHPIHKKEIASRFVLLALAKTYNRNLVCSGPEISSAFQQNDKAEIIFKNAIQLQTSNNRDVAELEIAGTDKIFKPVTGKLEGNKIILNSLQKELTQIRYGWKPFSRGNLINEKGLPASTFKIEIQKIQ